MLPRVFHRTLKDFYDRRPFAPFTVQLNTGERFEVDPRDGLAFREMRSFYIDKHGAGHRFDPSSVVKFEHAGDVFPNGGSNSKGSSDAE